MGHLKPSQLTSGQRAIRLAITISCEKRSGMARAGRMPAATSETRRRRSLCRWRRRPGPDQRSKDVSVAKDIMRAIAHEVILEVERLQVSQEMVLVCNPPCVVKDTFQGGTAFPGLEWVLPFSQRPSMRKVARADVNIILVELGPVLKEITRRLVHRMHLPAGPLTGGSP